MYVIVIPQVSHFSLKEKQVLTECRQNTTTISRPLSLIVPIPALLSILQEQRQLSHLYRDPIVMHLSLFLQSSTLLVNLIKSFALIS